MQLQKLLFIFSLLFSVSYANNNVVEFCVADLKSPVGPIGYPCRNPASVTVDDFVYSGLAAASNQTNIFKFSTSIAFDHQFAALNGQGLSTLRADIGVGGAIPLHSHRATELIYMVEGTMLTGFISADNKPYYKTLNKGDIMVIPQGSYHFSVNTGKTPVTATATFNSANPGVQVFPTAIGSNNLPTDVVSKITLLDAAQIQKLKKLLGGTN